NDSTHLQIATAGVTPMHADTAVTQPTNAVNTVNGKSSTNIPVCTEENSTKCQDANGHGENKCTDVCTVSRKIIPPGRDFIEAVCPADYTVMDMYNAQQEYKWQDFSGASYIPDIRTLSEYQKNRYICKDFGQAYCHGGGETSGGTGDWCWKSSHA